MADRTNAPKHRLPKRLIHALNTRPSPSLKVFVITVMIGFIVIGAVLILLFRSLSQIDDLANQNQQNQINGHNQRLQDEAAAKAREDEKIAQLACGIVAVVKPGLSPQIDNLRIVYDCKDVVIITPTGAATSGSPGPSPNPPTAVSSRPTATATPKSQTKPSVATTAPSTPVPSVPVSTPSAPVVPPRPIISLPKLCVPGVVCLG